jgi:hypothetical protein
MSCPIKSKTNRDQSADHTQGSKLAQKKAQIFVLMWKISLVSRKILAVVEMSK